MPIQDILAHVATLKAGIENLTVDDLKAELDRGGILLADLRELQERADDGTIPSSRHVPRGILEFWADPKSPFHQHYFEAEDRRIVLFCALGARSALAVKTLQDMGYTNVAHLDGGFTAWQAAGEAIEAIDADQSWSLQGEAAAGG